MSLDEWLGIGLPDDIVEEAIVWVAKLDGGEINVEEKQAFFAWLDSAPEHQWAYEEISEAWSKLRGLQAVKESLIRSEVLHLPARSPIAVGEPNHTGYSLLSWVSICLMIVGMFAGVID